MKKIALHWQILIGMALGLILGLVLKGISGGDTFVTNWIYPIGKIFINMLKLIAIPLIIASLIKGISDLQDISKFSRMGARTIGIYILTTVIAISLGLLIVNIWQPGEGVPQGVVEALTASEDNQEGASKAFANAQGQQGAGPLQPLIDIVPDNVFAAMTDNGNMLQVIFFVIFFGICLLLIPKEKAQPLMDFFDGLNEVILKMVDLIMLIAPLAVFALMAYLAVNTDPIIFSYLGQYAGAVVLGLALMVGVYTAAVFLFTGRTPGFFLSGISPAQLLAFSTSSSAATLPVTMERVEEHLGVEKEVTSFVCPVGATINMDGTSLYQAVAAVFICQVMQYDLTFADQLTIIVTATLASIGSAAVPGAGMVMLIIVLESVGLPTEKLAPGIALIFAVDRPLDMCRTAINVTGDATVAMLVAKSVGKLSYPKVKDWDDNLGQY